METTRSISIWLLIALLAASCGRQPAPEEAGDSATAKSLGMTAVTLQGIVQDSAGMPVPNVLISISSEEATVRDIGAMTNAEGKFRFTDLQPATYTVVAVLGDKRVDTEVDLSDPAAPEEAVIVWK